MRASTVTTSARTTRIQAATIRPREARSAVPSTRASILPSVNSVAYLGHATVLMELDGTRLLTDPLLRRRVTHLRRAEHRRCGRRPGRRRRSDLARSLRPPPPAFARRASTGPCTDRRAEGLGRLVTTQGIRSVTEVDEGDEVEFGSAHRAGDARRARRQAAARPGDAAPALGYVDRGLAARSTSPATPPCSTEWPGSCRTSTSRSCRSGAGARASAVGCTSTRRSAAEALRLLGRGSRSRSTGARTGRCTSGRGAKFLNEPGRGISCGKPRRSRPRSTSGSSDPASASRSSPPFFTVSVRPSMPTTRTFSPGSAPSAQRASQRSPTTWTWPIGWQGVRTVPSASISASAPTCSLPAADFHVPEPDLAREPDEARARDDQVPGRVEDQQDGEGGEEEHQTGSPGGAPRASRSGTRTA